MGVRRLTAQNSGVLRHLPDRSTPVLVLRSAAHGGLAITRSLGSWGVPVYTVESNPLTPAFYSRYSRGKFLWNVEQYPADESVSFLRSISQTLGRGALLFPTGDQAAIFLAENADALSPFFKFSRQSPLIVKALCSKKDLYWRARKSGVPMPETLFPLTRTEVACLARSLTYPVLLKGIDGDRMFKKSRKRMVIISRWDELLRAYDHINDPPNVMVQNYIPGPEDNCWIFHAYFNAKSECLATFTGKKMRQCRAYAGATSLGICVKNTVIEDMLIPFLRDMAYSGLVDVCLRYDPKDGLYKVLDVNPRIGANFRLFVSASGFDLARAYYLDMTGQPCNCEPIREQRKWMVEDFDLVSSLRYWWDGSLGLREWVSSLRGVDEFGYLSVSDPLPMVARFVDDVAELSRRFKRRVLRRRSLQSHSESIPENRITTA